VEELMRGGKNARIQRRGKARFSTNNLSATD